MEHLKQAILEKDWKRLRSVLDNMTNMQRRRSETYLRTTILPQLTNDEFWQTLAWLVSYRHQAFLSGVMAAEGLAKNGTIDLRCEGAQELADWLRKNYPAGIPKVLDMLLPRLHTEEQIEAMLQTFEADDNRAHITALLRCNTPLTLHALFNTLRHMPEGRRFALLCAQQLMHKGGDMAWNMAAILHTYFGLEELQGRFSLHIEPYELARLDTGPEVFYHLLSGRRPEVNL